MRKPTLCALVAIATCGLVAGIAEAKRLPIPVATTQAAVSLQDALREISGTAIGGDVYCRKLLERCDRGDLWACAAWERNCVPAD